jgi:5-deoxy-glucuronate isomerase
MPTLIRNYDNQNKPIIDKGDKRVPLTYFNLLRLSKGQLEKLEIGGYETVYVVLSGSVDILVGETNFSAVGKRKDLWSGRADSVYAPPGAGVKVSCLSATAEIAVAGGRCDTAFDPFRITPEEEIMVEVGSLETHSLRRIFHILGKNAEGRNGKLLVSELYADPGCWSGYPPHKHDEDIGTAKEGFEETGFEEVYYYRFNPENGFGAQFTYQKDGSSEVFMVKNGDTAIIDRGYHPTVTSPGHGEYIFTILVGKTTRSLVQNFKEEYRYLTKVIPGVKDMVDNFK